MKLSLTVTIPLKELAEKNFEDLGDGRVRADICSTDGGSVDVILTSDDLAVLRAAVLELRG